MSIELCLQSEKGAKQLLHMLSASSQPVLALSMCMNSQDSFTHSGTEYFNEDFDPPAHGLSKCAPNLDTDAKKRLSERFFLKDLILPMLHGRQSKL